MIPVAGIDATAVGTAAGGIVVAITGVAAYVTNRRVASQQRKLDRTAESADLNRAEVQGWKTLIETLRTQYADVVLEAGVLRGQLAERGVQLDRVTDRLADAHREIAVLHERITVLRSEVTRLGGNVDEINRHGKRGETGDKGPVGDKGETGDTP